MEKALQSSPSTIANLLKSIVGYWNTPANPTGSIADLDFYWIFGAILLIVMIVEFFKTIRWIFGGNKK